MEWRHTTSPIKKIQTDHLNSQDHAHSVLGQKMHSACGSLASRLNNQPGVYCDTFKKLRRAIQNKQHGILSRGVVMLHDNVHPQTAAATQDLIATFGWEQFDHSPYIPDLTPCDFHAFLLLKTFIGGRWSHDDNEVKEDINTWFGSQAASFYDAGIQKLVPRYNRCLNNGGNYVKK
jgi:hypothetical protein